MTVLLTVLSAGLVAAVWMLPQLPGQLADEPVSAGRWLGDVSTEYGQWGTLFLALGLFHVVRSPLLFVVLTGLAAKAGAWLAEEVAAARQFRAVAQVLLAEPSDGADALPLPAPPSIAREQVLLPVWPPDGEALREHLLKSYAKVVTGMDDVEASDAAEQRFLGLRNERLSLLRMLAPGGMLIALTGIWLSVMLGEQMLTPILAPGETYRSVESGISLRYMPPLSVVEDAGTRESGPVEQADEFIIGGAGSPPRLAVMVSFAEPGADLQQAELGLSAPEVNAPNGAHVTMRSEGVALWVAAQSPTLARPGSDRLRSEISLVFSQRGGEESILLPDLSAGLRFVARPGGARNDSRPIVVELYRSGLEEPVLRGEVPIGESASIKLDGAESIHVVAMPGLRVEARQAPGLALVWFGLALMAVAVIAYVRPPGFLMVQARPWPPDGTLVTVQSNRRESAARVSAALVAPDVKTPN